MSYNGWTNRETWNIAMWISNDEKLNRIMTQGAQGDWERFKALAMQFGITKTPDGVSFEDPKVNQDELRKTNMSCQEDIEEEDDEDSVLEGRRLLKTRSFYI